MSTNRPRNAAERGFRFTDKLPHDLGHRQNRLDPAGGLTRREQRLVA
jgi:hypothetical protein